MQNLGETRSAYERDHMLLTPDSFVRAPLPGMKNATAIVHVGPARGAGFTEYMAEMENGGTLGTVPAFTQRFLYVIDGSVVVDEGKKSTLWPGGYAYLPAGTQHTVTAARQSRVVVIEKAYKTLGGAAAAEVVIGKEQNVAPVALNGDEWLQVRALLPDDPAIDFAVNTMEFQPGAGLSQVEIHVMEHGLLMLDGGGVYRLGEKWYPVQKGDFIYMAPYCPQWFCSVGKTPARYLIYKDWNRHPLG
ncbi:MAG TPA: (S)-ureidoglycine aminohydrolase [Acidobacteriaceae bacterium]